MDKKKPSAAKATVVAMLTATVTIRVALLASGGPPESSSYCGRTSY
jgi:hypothetical protein